MNLLPIREADCTLLEAELALSLDVGELANLLSSHGLEPSTCSCGTLAERVLSAAHRACHERPRFAAALQRRLDFVHARALKEVEEEGLRAVGEELIRRDFHEIEDMAGKLWALLRSRDTLAPALRATLKHRLALTATRSLTQALMPTQAPAIANALR